MSIAEYIYYLGLSVKKYIAFKQRKHLPFRVISIGNITVGGTGKTPAAIAIAEEAKKRGYLPIILTRGYKGTAKGICFVTKGDGPLLTSEEAGDEPYLMAERLKGVPVVKGPDRYEAGMFAVNAINIQPSAVSTNLTESLCQKLPEPIFILDDGFQHWRLNRDIDIVLVDSNNPFGNRRLLPAGRLREPLSELKRADIIVATRSEREDAGLIAELRRYNQSAPVFFSSHRAVSIRTATGERKPLDFLKDQAVYCFCGLAEPSSFLNTVSASGANITGSRNFRDHYGYTRQDTIEIARDGRASGAAWIVTTEKDFVKLRNLDLPENILIIEIEFSASANFFDAVFG